MEGACAGVVTNRRVWRAAARMRLGIGAIGEFFSPSGPFGPPTGAIFKRNTVPALQRSQSLSSMREAPSNGKEV